MQKNLLSINSYDVFKLNLPSWKELSPKISKFQKEVDYFLQNRIASFKDNNPLIDKTIRSIIQVLPPPFNSFFENFYNTSENSDLVKRLEEIRQLVIRIQNSGKENYSNTVNAGGDVIGLNVDGNGNIIAKNFTLVVNEVKEFFGFELISKGYFSGINSEAIEAIFKEEWISGFELSKESIYHGKEFRREKVLKEIKTLLEKNKSLLLLGETGTSKTTLLKEVLSDYYKDHYNDDFIILYTEGITEPREPNKVIETIRQLLNAGNKILVVVDNVHEIKLASIFYIIRRLQFFYSSSIANSGIRFILAARQPEYQNLIVKERFSIDTHYMDALQMLNKNKQFTMDVPAFTNNEVKQFIRQYRSYLPVTRKYKSLEQNTDEIYKDTMGHPILVRFEVTGEGIRKDVENRYKNYLSRNVDGSQRPDYNKIITSFVCSIYHISTCGVDDNALKSMKIHTYEDGIAVERDLYWFANDLDRSVLYRSKSDGKWKTLHVKWALELFKFIFENFKSDRNIIEKFKQCLLDSIGFMIQNETEDVMLDIYKTIYSTIPSNKSIDFEIIKEVARVPEQFSNRNKTILYSLVICPAVGDQDGHEEEIKCYDKVITDLDPNFSDAYNNKGEAIRRLGVHDNAKYEEAIKCFDKAIDLDAMNGLAHYNKGVTLSALGELGDHAKYDEAIKCYNKAISLDPSYVNAYYNKGTALTKLGDLGDHAKYEEAIKCFDEAISLDPTDTSAYINKGTALVRLGDLGDHAKYEEAIKCFDRVTKLDPEMAVAYYNKGTTLSVLADLGDHLKYEEAIKCYDKAIGLQPNYSEAYNNKGNDLRKLGGLGDHAKYDEAIKCFDKAIGLDAKKVESYYNKGIALSALGELGDHAKYEEAIKCYGRVIELDPTDTQAYYAKGMTLSALGELGDHAKYEEAIKCLDRALELDPNSANGYYARSHIQITKKQIINGLNDLEKAVELDPSIIEYAKNNKAFESLKDNERFKSLLMKGNK